MDEHYRCTPVCKAGGGGGCSCVTNVNFFREIRKQHHSKVMGTVSILYLKIAKN